MLPEGFVLRASLKQLGSSLILMRDKLTVFSKTGTVSALLLAVNSDTLLLLVTA